MPRTKIQRTLSIICGLVAVLALLSPAVAAEPASPLKVHLISGCTEYKSDESLAEFQKYLEGEKLAVCTRSFGKDSGEGLPNLEALDTCDVAIVFTRRIRLPADQLERIKKYCQAGRPIVGVRTASHAFQNYLEIDKEVWGGNYKGHDRTPKAEVSVVEAAKDHPILAGVKSYSSAGKVYRNAGHADDITVLLTVASTENTQPAAWTRRYNGGRTFYTSLGHPEDFQDENFRRLLVNALFWTVDRAPPK